MCDNQFRGQLGQYIAQHIESNLWRYDRENEMNKLKKCVS